MTVYTTITRGTAGGRSYACCDEHLADALRHLDAPAVRVLKVSGRDGYSCVGSHAAADWYLVELEEA